MFEINSNMNYILTKSQYSANNNTTRNTNKTPETAESGKFSSNISTRLHAELKTIQPGRTLCNMNNAYWKHLDHRADIGIQGVGPSLEQAFAQAGLALMAVMCDLELIHRKESRIINLEGHDPELLFFDFLNELIFLVSAEGFAYSWIEADINDGRLRARVLGESLDSLRHQPEVEVKGASFNGLKVWQDKNGKYIATCIVDV